MASRPGPTWSHSSTSVTRPLPRDGRNDKKGVCRVSAVGSHLDYSSVLSRSVERLERFDVVGGASTADAADTRMLMAAALDLHVRKIGTSRAAQELERALSMCDALGSRGTHAEIFRHGRCLAMLAAEYKNACRST